MSLPKVLTSIVVRAANKGDSHGAAYLIDLEKETFEQVLDYSNVHISWDGRGGDRGLRGIAFYQGHVYLASHNQVLVYNQEFRLVESLGNAYLGQIHEICIDQDSLWVTSTSYDSVLLFDLLSKTFTKGYCIRRLNMVEPKNVIGQFLRRLKRRFPILDNDLRVVAFDPNTSKGPSRYDDYHVNNVYAKDNQVFIAPGRGRCLLQLENDQLKKVCRIPSGTHNAQPYQEGVIFNDTSHKVVRYTNSREKDLELFPVVTFNENDLKTCDLPDKVAATSWARGLCFFNDKYLISGVSPAAISVYRFGQSSPVKMVSLSKDIRLAVHGLEIWPY